MDHYRISTRLLIKMVNTATTPELAKEVTDRWILPFIFAYNFAGLRAQLCAIKMGVAERVPW